jgi:TPR repeat protein
MRCALCALWVALIAPFSFAQDLISAGNPPDPPYSKRLLSRAQSGSPHDEFLLGRAYATGSAVQQNFAQATYWYRRAANGGDDGAINELGRMYAEGSGVPRDYQQALLWFRRAASDGTAAAQNNLGLMYFRGLGMTADPEAAVSLWKKAAEHGSVRAESNLGFAYLVGNGTGKADPGRAVKLLRKAADRGIAEAQFNLGYCFEKGLGVRAQASEAVQFYRKSAAQGYVAAQANLGLLYLKGQGQEKKPEQGPDQGVPQNLSEALRLLRLAANGGNSRAYLGLAYMYHTGAGVSRDDAVAYSWLQLAKEKGEPGADAVQIAPDQLTRSQITEAHLRTQNWRSSHPDAPAGGGEAFTSLQ